VGLPRAQSGFDSLGHILAVHLGQYLDFELDILDLIFGRFEVDNLDSDRFGGSSVVSDVC
jgi:hypothetical protein